MERPLAPTGALVARLWDTSEESTPIEGWQLTDFEHGTDAPLFRRVLLGVALLAVVGIAGWLGWQRWQEAAAADLGAVSQQAAALAATSAAAENVAADLGDGVIGEPLAAATTLGSLDAEARELFDLASELPADAVRAERLRALDAAQQALDVEAGLGDAVAYEAAFHLLLVEPDLPIEANDDRIPVIAADIAAWVSRFVDGASGLPGHPLLAYHRDEVQTLAATLPDWQSSYLDALRRGDDTAAAARVDELMSSLDELEAAWTTAGGRVADWAAGELATLHTTLSALNPPG